MKKTIRTYVKKQFLKSFNINLATLLVIIVFMFSTGVFIAYITGILANKTSRQIYLTNIKLQEDKFKADKKIKCYQMEKMGSYCKFLIKQ